MLPNISVSEKKQLLSSTVQDNKNPLLNGSNHTFKSLDNDFKQQTYWSSA